MLIDAHLHIKNECPNPIEALIADMRQHSIDKGVLILNTPEEQDFALRCPLHSFDNGRLKLVVGLNPHDDRCQTVMNDFAHNGIAVNAVKIHPRLMKITRKDFDDIELLLDKCNAATVVIDTLVYGPRYEYNCGIELGIFLAEKNLTRKVVLAHSGSTRLLECMMMTRWLPNIYYDYSFICTYFAQTSIRTDMLNQLRITDERIIYGSDYPSFGLGEAKDSFLELCHEVGYTKEQTDKVMFRNAEMVYFNQ